MMQTEPATPRDPDPALIQAAQTALGEAFGCRFDMWSSADLSCRSHSEDLPAAADPSAVVAEFLKRSPTAGIAPSLVEQSGDRHLLFIPICHNGKVQLVAMASFETSTPELLIKLGRLFLRESDQRERLQRHAVEKNAYLVEITQSFEELSFLRRIAEYLDLSELSQDRWKMANTILPMLCGSIKAESLVLIPTQESGKSSGTVSIEVGQPAVWIGSRSIDVESCRQLVEQYRLQATVQPVVKNDFQEMAEGSRYPGVRNFLLVPMSAAGRTSGWLLALNRVAPKRIGPRQGRCVLSEREFGTVEAGSVSSVASILATHARNVELLEQKSQLFLDAVRSLVSAVDAKDPYTCGHSERVALFAKQLGRELGLDDEASQRLYLAGMLHDVGKIGISGAVLRKPGRLTDEEYGEIKQHPERAWTMLHNLEHLQHILPGILYHHEQYDGKGYPDGLAGDQIPPDARILAVADAYDAMTSDRPYRKGMPQEKVEAILREGAGTQWDPQVVEVCLEMMPEIVKIRQSYQPRPRPLRKPDSAAVPVLDTTWISPEMQPTSEP